MDDTVIYTEIVKTKVQIEVLLGERAIVTCDEEQHKITIRTPPLKRCCTGYFLELIRDLGWNDIKIGQQVEVELVDWLIDTTDHNFGSDLWCLEWMKNNYNIVDKCERV